MNINYMLYRIMDEYLEEKELLFGGNDLAAFIRNEPKNVFKEIDLFKSENILVKGSAGQGQWANIPWIGIFNENIRKTAQEGIYIVFLFSEDMKKVYLSLNQGITYIKEEYGIEQIEPISSNIREKYFENINDNRMVKNIDLNIVKGKDLGSNYESGHIIGFEYNLEDILTEDIELDLNILMEYYSIIIQDINIYSDFILDMLNYKQDKNNEIIMEKTEGYDVESIVTSRIGQSELRRRILNNKKKCEICNITNQNLLIISHIKPWNKSNSSEKTDENNILLLCPNHDALFDKGFISFDKCGNLLVSDLLDDNNLIGFNIKRDIKIDMNENLKRYLKYHRENIFLSKLND